MVHLETVLLCEALSDSAVSILSFATFFCSVHMRLLHCKMRSYIICFLVASFALWFCDCVVLLSISLTDDDIKIQRRHIEFRKIGDGLPQNRRWVSLESVPDFLQNRTKLLPKTGAFFLLDQHQSLPKAYFLLLLQFRISTHSPKGQEHRKKKNCIPQIFSRFSFHFTSIFHFPSCQNDNSACAHKSIPQTNHHFNEFLPLHFPCLVPRLGETLR